MNMLYLSGPYLPLAIKTGIVSGILALTEGIAVERTFSALKNYQVDGNKEMMAIGLMNMAGSCSSCYVRTGSFSRSAVNYNAGATAVLITLLFLMPLFYYTPIVGVSVFKILLHVTRPNTGVLGNIPGTHVYQNMNRYRTAVRIPSFLILAVEAPIYFANSTYLQERLVSKPTKKLLLPEFAAAAAASALLMRPATAADRGARRADRGWWRDLLLLLIEAAPVEMGGGGRRSGMGGWIIC
ncbi:hypothetical protein KY289_021085 [Solanum tuberosum]|nr:hypothetical protein KY289_021085 [Solanum tuberosum]